MDTYTLNVMGFSLDQDGTNPFTSFWTAEGARNNAYLVGNVALLKNVQPDPNSPNPQLWRCWDWVWPVSASRAASSN